MNRIKEAAFVVFLVLAAQGCTGEKDASETVVARGNLPAAAGVTPADEAAASACPPRLTSPARTAEAPVDDVLGVRPGQTYDDVMAILACHPETPLLQTVDRWSSNIQTFGIPTRQAVRASDGRECDGQEILRGMGSMGGTRDECASDGSFKVVKDVTDQVYVVFTGLHGKEIAGAVWRARKFPEAERPTVESVRGALAEKYGQPRQVTEDRWGTTLYWVYDALGRPMSESNPAFMQCNSIGPKFQFGHSWSAACGLTIKALIEPVQTNELLVGQLHIAVMNQQQFFEAGERFSQELAAENERIKREQAGSGASVGAKDL